MSHYQAPDNTVHFLDDDSFANLLPAGSVAITDEEAATIAAANQPVVDPNDALKAQISQLESEQLLPRVTREFMLTAFEAQAAAAGVDPATSLAYTKVKTFDEQIAALRSQLT